MTNMITGIISITIGALLLATVFMSTIKNQNTTVQMSDNLSGSWSTSEIAMWSLISLLGIVGLLYGVLNVFGLA